MPVTVLRSGTGILATIPLASKNNAYKTRFTDLDLRAIWGQAPFSPIHTLLFSFPSGSKNEIHASSPVMISKSRLSSHPSYICNNSGAIFTHLSFSSWLKRWGTHRALILRSLRRCFKMTKNSPRINVQCLRNLLNGITCVFIYQIFHGSDVIFGER